MQTLKEYMESSTASNKLESITNVISNLDIPSDLKAKILSIVEDNEYEIMEDHYNSLVSDAEDYAYEQFKEEKYFGGNDWKETEQRTETYLKIK